MRQGLHGQLGCFRLAIGLAALGLLPAAASADTLFAEIYATPLRFVWATPPVPADGAAAYSGDVVPLVSTDEFANELYVSGPPPPGLQFSLNPVQEEIFVGWRFKF